MFIFRPSIRRGKRISLIWRNKRNGCLAIATSFLPSARQHAACMWSLWNLCRWSNLATAWGTEHSTARRCWLTLQWCACIIWSKICRLLGWATSRHTSVVFGTSVTGNGWESWPAPAEHPFSGLMPCTGQRGWWGYRYAVVAPVANHTRWRQFGCWTVLQ